MKKINLVSLFTITFSIISIGISTGTNVLAEEISYKNHIKNTQESGNSPVIQAVSLHRGVFIGIDWNGPFPNLALGTW